MRTTATVLLMLVRVTGVFQLILGLVLWSGSVSSLIRLHIAVGILFVLALLALAGLAIAAGGAGGRALPVIGIIWGVLVAALGLAQTSLMPGSHHWVVQDVHLLVGLAAIGLGEVLGGHIRGAA